MQTPSIIWGVRKPNSKAPAICNFQEGRSFTSWVSCLMVTPGLVIFSSSLILLELLPKCPKKFGHASTYKFALSYIEVWASTLKLYFKWLKLFFLKNIPFWSKYKKKMPKQKTHIKGELLFCSVEQVKLINVHWLCSSSKIHHILAQ